MVMTAHLFNSNWDANYPASLSENVIQNLLRDSLGFNGVVISDEMFMNAISQNYGFEEAVVLAVNAGTDILLFSKNEYNGNSLVAEVVNIIKQKISDGLVQENRINEAYARITELKNVLTEIEENEDAIIPETFSLQTYPNPFNITTNIVINLTQSEPVELKIYDVTGRLIYSNKYFNMSPGKHVIKFNADNLSSGMYIIRVDVPGNFTTGKVMLLK